MTQSEQIALERFNKGEKYGVSTFIDEDTIIIGYGNLDYDFEFPLPNEIVVKEFGTQSWDRYFRNKGLFNWLTINKETKEESLLGLRKTEAEIEELKKIEGDDNFEFVKL